MLEEKEFFIWAEAFNKIGKIFEGRFDVYPICRKWIDEWYKNNFYSINGNDNLIIKKALENHNYNVFRVNGDFFERKEENWKKIVENSERKIFSIIDKKIKAGECNNIGYCLAPYLFSWNYRRYKEYIKSELKGQSNFDIVSHFYELGNLILNLQKEFEYFHDKKIYYNKIEYDKVLKLYSAINDKLKNIGVGHNEPIATFKILHIMAPHYFPLIDNKIAYFVGLKKSRKSLTIEQYSKWIDFLKKYLNHYDFKKLDKFEELMGASILKIIDGGLYMMCTMTLSHRVEMIGLKI
jgi:hypothetical protein